ncbi:MAG: NHLP bacteriocin export ABC transporter permease/ATPase subunit, partial [Vicinamibacterales bacterium]|nr:NHLP bacteriocin export ABC transporter permease/ATPase subunit [Vicinamibacterales bacterium]
MTHGDEPVVRPETSFGIRVVASDDRSQLGWEAPVSTAVDIGRERDCFLVVGDTSVSRHHARVSPAAAGLRVVDLGSANGVWIGSTRVTDTVVGPGQRFRVGNVVCECVGLGPRVPDVADVATMIVPAPSQPAAPQVGGLRLRVVQAGAVVAEGREYSLEAASAVVGRSRECDLVIEEPEVSRKHVRIERTATGYTVTDLGSRGGVWAGTTAVTAADFPLGARIRLGSRLTLELLGDPAPAVPAPVSEPAAAGPPAPDPQSLPTPGPDPAVAPPAEAVAEPPQAPPVGSPEPAPAVPALTAPADVAAAPAEALAGGEPELFGRTVSMPIPPEFLAKTHRLETEGEEVKGEAHKPFLISDPSAAYYVVSGGVLLFTVAIEKGQPVGPRNHFLALLPGQLLFGLDTARYGYGSGFLAVSKVGTILRRIPIERLRELTAVRSGPMGALIETWVAGLSKTLMTGVEHRRAGDAIVEPGKPFELVGPAKATSSQGVVWVSVWNGSVLFVDMATPQFTHRVLPFPLTPDSWIQAVSDEFGPLNLEPMTTVQAMRETGFWNGLDAFHQVLCECEFVNKRLAAVDEYVRLEQKASRSEAAENAAYDAIGSVMSPEGGRPAEFLEAAAEQPILRACLAVGQVLGIEVRPYPGSSENFNYEEMVSAISSASGFKTRVVALRGDWWTYDHSSLLGQWADTKGPVALLQTSTRSYEALDAVTGTREPVTPAVAARLSDFAHTFYRPFPTEALTTRALLAFGAKGLSGEIRTLMFMGILVGLFGTITPYLTGQLFDQAIPQADRNMLVGFGVALVMSAAGTALFKFVQGVTTVRMQARMESAIQAAVWHRLLDLPTGFFRQYESGDLSDRAGGVDQIQQLLSGAGIAAILGSLSGLFYVFQMFSYDMVLAFAAVGLTAVFVAFNMSMNYAQLRSQRAEYAIRGRITGLVLNLITGVSKLRIAGAERHAFRLWAENFSAQRKISFKVGNIQSVAATFMSVYPLFCSIMIYSVMIWSQKQSAETGVPGLTTGDFIAFNTAFGMFMAAMQSLGDAALNLLKVVPVYERLRPILDEKPEVDTSKTFPGKLKGEIELAHVNFRYDPDGPLIVKDFSLKIKPGEFVAFVGGSGCGKSTLMRLMLGFETPASGAIYYDGQDMAALDLRMLRQQIGVVLQQSRVMPTEIYRNIVGPTSRTLDEAWEAAERSGFAEDIRNMPMGMHTYVSEGGGTLSGGQRQRLMIARAIVNKPKVLFLDEATSALDNRTQAIVTESMDRMDST